MALPARRIRFNKRVAAAGGVYHDSAPVDFPFLSLLVCAMSVR